MVAHRESAALAERLIAVREAGNPARPAHDPRRSRLFDALETRRLAPRGSRHHPPRTAARMSPTTTRSPRRSSRRSNIGPGFPDQFGSVEGARAFCQPFFTPANPLSLLVAGVGFEPTTFGL